MIGLALVAALGLHALPPVQSMERVGCATRSILFHDLYRLSLWENDGEAELIRMEILHEGNMPGGLPGDWRPKLSRTLQDDLIDRIDAAFALIEPGSLVDIAYIPQADESTMTIDGVLAVEASGRTAYDAIAAMWFGEDPISDDLAETITSGECAAG